MKSFRTSFQIPQSDALICHRKRLVLVGSCFSNNMQQWFQSAGFRVMANPFGIQYNPLPLFKSLQLGLTRQTLPKQYVDELPQGFVNWLAHHKKTFGKADEVFGFYNEKLNEISTVTPEDVVIITLGSSWLYELKKQNIVVANCHKAPNHLFEKRMASITEVIAAAQSVLDLLQNNQVIFTISPVRHLRDGFIENVRSKAVLHLAIAELVNQYQNVEYFPSYELVIDDLRDYRFYNQDMIHPNNEAVEYIWEAFSKTYFSKETQEFSKKCIQAHAAVNHKPLNLNSDASKKHFEKTMNKLNQLSKEGAHLEHAVELLKTNYLGKK